MTDYGPATERRIHAVVDACERYGATSIIALTGVPATGKSYIAAIAAHRYTDEPMRVREIQFHQSFTYEEFVEGLRIGAAGVVLPVPGVFLEWNDQAAEDGELRYALLIEELTRANVAAVLGELLTYIEHRDRQFYTLFSRRAVRIAKNLTIIATFNPVDRSAIDIDEALLRRLRIIDMPPDVEQLEEMLTGNGLPKPVIVRLKKVFGDCLAAFATDYETLMPFGHGVFAEIRTEEDLHPLWHQRLRRMLYRPTLDPHPFAETIEAAYPWRDPDYRAPAAASLVETDEGMPEIFPGIMIITVPERGAAEVSPSTWAILSRDHRFWRLVEDNVIQPEAGGAGRWRLRGACYVGRAVFGTLVLEVAEKFPGAFQTLVTFGALRPPKLTRTPSPVAPSPGSTGILISLFVRAARTYLSRFKRVAYVQVPDAGTIIGGRLDIVRTARLRAKGIFHQAAFDRSLLTADLPLNRCVYAALREVERLAGSVNILAQDLVSARALQLSLSECLPSVLSLRRAELAAVAARQIAEGHIRPEIEDVISLAGAVLDAAGFGGPDTWKRTIDRSWFVNLEIFFQDAIRCTIAQVLDSFIVSGPQDRPPLFDREKRRYRANPDVLIRWGPDVLAIGDAKYKDFSDWPSAADVHEILAHAVAYGASVALLFYPDEVGFSVRTFGLAATGCRLWAFGIDFRDFEGSIRRALDIAGLTTIRPQETS